MQHVYACMRAETASLVMQLPLAARGTQQRHCFGRRTYWKSDANNVWLQIPFELRHWHDHRCDPEALRCSDSCPTKIYERGRLNSGEPGCAKYTVKSEDGCKYQSLQFHPRWNRRLTVLACVFVRPIGAINLSGANNVRITSCPWFCVRIRGALWLYFAVSPEEFLIRTFLFFSLRHLLFLESTDSKSLPEEVIANCFFTKECWWKPAWLLYQSMLLESRCIISLSGDLENFYSQEVSGQLAGPILTLRW